MFCHVDVKISSKRYMSPVDALVLIHMQSAFGFKYAFGKGKVKEEPPPLFFYSIGMMVMIVL